MRLADDWRDVLRRAWSVRLMLLAGLLTGAEAVVHLTGLDWLPLPVWARLLLVFGVVGAAFVARLVAQEGLEG